MGAQEGNQGAQEVVLGLQAPIQEGVGLGQNVAQEGHLFINLNINMVLTQDQQKCPSSTPFICSLSQEEVGTSTPGLCKTAKPDLKEARSPKKARVRLGIKAAPECESSVRRSDRIKAKSKGFRRSSCQDNTCLSCTACPPTISADAIQSLGTKVCALDRTKIGPGKLSFNSGSQKPIGRTTTTRFSEAHSKGKEALSEASSNSSNGV
uniref:Uncharacterized protein n=1 Tax=Setaria viridis TaxID=4556 RepID=A0A4U6WCT9_SETVI|nr:hypothetical protein SEVIR_1G238100v2 [Setaria viridis]